MSRLADALSGTPSRSASAGWSLPNLPPAGPRRSRWRVPVALGMLVIVAAVGGVLIWERGGQAPSAAKPRLTPSLTPIPAPPIAPAPTSDHASRALLAQGLHAAQSGALADAAVLFTNALELHGADADAWNNLGVVRHRQGDTAGGVEAFRRALRINPRHAEAHRNLGVALDGQDRLPDAASHYRAYLRLTAEADPSRPAVARRLREMTASGSKP